MRRREEIESAFAPTDALSACEAFYLVGIGGAGMSALARMLAHRRFVVVGSDSSRGQETERLQEEGFEITIGHSGATFTDFARKHPSCALIVTDAVDLDSSPEYQAAVAIGKPVVRRSQALGWLLRPYRVIAVTGTHGKTTTTGLLGAGLIAAGLDPLVVVGAAIMDWNGPVREGEGPYAVVEACEAYEAYADLDPFIVLLTNLEPDHLDYHGSYERLRESVKQFVSRVPREGGLVYCADDRGASEIAELTEVRCMPYGMSQAWLQQVSNKHELGIAADATGLTPMIPGDHNKMNAVGALAAASLLNEHGVLVDLDLVEEGISRFGGAERRLQTIFDGDYTIIDDYAHHPSEVSASLLAIRARYPNRRLTVVFQPHMYSRTAEHIDAFAEALSGADRVVLTDIYAAREMPIPGISSARIAEKVTVPMTYVPSRLLLPRKVAPMVQKGDIIVGMGAGTISEFPRDLLSELERKRSGPLSIIVLCGGDSSEREVSILSGNAVTKALKSLGHKVRKIDITDQLLRKGSVLDFIGPQRPDVVFLALHGVRAEDGAIQGMMELLHLPYTGSGIHASAVAMDKQRTKTLLESVGIRVPKGQLVLSEQEPISVPAPAVVKPNAEGSTVGLTFATSDAEIRSGVRTALQYPGGCLVEEWIEGMEISVPVLVDAALPPVEICPASGKYDFASKYTPGATEEIVPARLPDELLTQAQAIAQLAHRTLGCRGASRTDMIVRGGEIFVLEVNTLPGMTSTSLLPNSALAAGISYEQLCQRLVEDALERHD